MEKRKRTPPRGRSPARRWRRLALGLAGILAIACVSWAARGMLAWWARDKAADYLDRWALTAARTWIARATWLDPGNGELVLMEAVCDRRWGQTEWWRKALQRARAMGVPRERIEQEIQLGLIRSGQSAEPVGGRLVALLETGVSARDVGSAFLEGYLARGEADKARLFLGDWQRRNGDQPHGAYLWGLYWLRMQAPRRALEQFQKAVAGEPWHELARKMVAELLEAQNRLPEALDQQLELVRRFPRSEIARIGLARVLRKMNRLGDARQVLGPLAAGPHPTSKVAVEMGRIELEQGNYQEADRWFAAADLDREEDFKVLSSAAIAFALAENGPRAEGLFARHDAAVHRSVRTQDLQVRLTIDPYDQSAAGALRRLLSEGPGNSMGTGKSRPGPAGQPLGQGPGAALYEEHCRACHGARGGGDGRAARHLYPPPRDFRTGRFRLVRTRNGVPTREDIISVTQGGIPGTSMPAYDTLTEQELEQVAGEVLKWYRRGVREQFVRLLEQEGDPVDEEELAQMVEESTMPGEPVEVPAIGPPEAGALMRGHQTYQELGCPKCHGDDGAGAWDARVFDEKRRPARPRDLVHEPLKGGAEPESIYRRIAVGMPGSPHPATWNLAPGELIDLVRFCRSLAQRPPRDLTNHQQATWSTVWAYRAAFGEAPPRLADPAGAPRTGPPVSSGP